MKKLLLIPALILMSSCNGEDLEPYDPVAQLEIDLNLIDEHLSGIGEPVVIHSSGIRYSIENIGDGNYPVDGDSVATLYEIYTLDGQLIDTTDEDLARANGIYSTSRNYQPFEYKVGDGTVIDGYVIGTQLLNEGANGTFYVPSTLAYRNMSHLGLDPNEILRIKIQVEEIF